MYLFYQQKREKILSMHFLFGIIWFLLMLFFHPPSQTDSITRKVKFITH